MQLGFKTLTVIFIIVDSLFRLPQAFEEYRGQRVKQLWKSKIFKSLFDVMDANRTTLAEMDKFLKNKGGQINREKVSKGYRITVDSNCFDLAGSPSISFESSKIRNSIEKMAWFFIMDIRQEPTASIYSPL